MCVPRRTGSVKPRSPTHIRILRVILERSVLIGLPEGLQPIEGVFLNDTVVCVRRAWPSIPDDRALSDSIRGVSEEISPEIILSVVDGERRPLRRDPLKAG